MSQVAFREKKLLNIYYYILRRPKVRRLLNKRQNRSTYKYTHTRASYPSLSHSFFLSRSASDTCDDFSRRKVPLLVCSIGPDIQSIQVGLTKSRKTEDEGQGGGLVVCTFQKWSSRADDRWKRRVGACGRNVPAKWRGRWTRARRVSQKAYEERRRRSFEPTRDSEGETKSRECLGGSRFTSLARGTSR